MTRKISSIVNCSRRAPEDLTKVRLLMRLIARRQIVEVENDRAVYEERQLLVVGDDRPPFPVA